MNPALRFVSLLAPSVFSAYRAVVAHIGRQVGIEATLKVGNSLASVEGESGAFVCGLPYVLLMRRPQPGIELLGAPVLVGSRYEGKPIYFSDLIVRADSSFEVFQDLRGSSLAYNEPLSQSGYGVLRARLVELNETSGFFGRVHQAGFHDRSIELVADGAVDCAVIDSQVLEIRYQQQPEIREKLRIIDVLGPSTIQPLVVSSSLDAGLRKEMLSALVSAHEAPDVARAMLDCRISHWVPMQDSDYDDIRRQLEGAESAGFLEIR